MTAVNTCIFMGRLGKDPDMRYLQSGTAVVNTSIAVNKVSKVDGEYKTATTWIDLVFYGALAERAAKALAKGDLVLITAEYQVNSSTLEDGSRRQYHKFVVSGFERAAQAHSSSRGGQSSEEEDDDDQYDQYGQDEEEFPF